ncbi:hypothetical protein [Desulfofustis glycolicus]|uniref:MJ0042 family finger-like domain-containing protein n=1 Tax=Desulfofustis glycolicus DSM 9705 TaxID=1121409 RepID=A0A1M5VIG9_9BACT|nr:hypothetical protein [Desulfofustis glycolicus]SHH74978.1 hypothetical protein SAMN02745124_01717 [Desulfofustis glycolicus DSM 9705]
MKVRCPHCRIRGDVSATLSGRVVRCPRCLASFRVPLLHRPEERFESVQPDPTGPEKRPDSRSASGSSDAADQKIAGVLVRNLSGDESGLGVVPEFQSSQRSDGLPQFENGDDPHATTAASAGDCGALEHREAVVADPDPATIDERVEPLGAQEEFPDLSAQSVAWEDVTANSDDGAAVAGERSGGPDSLGATVDTEEKLQEQLAALLSETSHVSDKEVSGDESGEDERGDDCRKDPAVGDEKAGPSSLVGDDDDFPVSASSAGTSPLPGYTPDGGFRATAILKAAWTMVTGVKGPIWGGILLLFAVLVGVETAATLLVPFATAFGGEALAVWLQIIVQMAGAVLLLTFLAGLYTIGVRRSCGSHYSWRTVFSGFPCIGRIGVAGILMSLLIASGFVLLILPGIYLAVGYSLTLPLMVVKRYGPWEAMEASRRLIHPRWWQVCGIYIVMYLIYVLSCIPFGIGLFWTVPMLFTLTGVLYRSLVPEHTGK